MNNRYVLERKSMSHNILASFFDVYITLDKYAEMKEITPLLLEMYPAHSDLIKRNQVTAHSGLDEYEQAEAIASDLVANNPTALNHYSLYKVYRQTDKDMQAYEQMEMCVQLDPDDSDYALMMAGLILDEYYIKRRDMYGESIMKVSKQQAIAAAIPFVFHAYSTNSRNVAEFIDFLKKNNLYEAANVLYACAKQQITEIPRSEEYDYEPLDLCLSKSEQF